MGLYERLKAYGKSDYYGFHMPGHKRNKELLQVNLPYEIDITEIHGFDDLHDAKGILREAEERAAGLFHGEETHFLVNGSSVGILSAILGSTERGDQILVARNCHKSVYHAIELGGLCPIYLYPEEEKSGLYGVLTPETVSEALEQNADARCVVIVSPTYDGVVSDVEGIAEVVHEKGIPLIVDEAHGAHFGFHSYFPENANQQGGDIVIHSVHKTLPSLTQTALLHINGNRVDRQKVRKYLRMLQSSSPSYVLMASIDACMDFLEREGEKSFDTYVHHLTQLRDGLKEMKHLQLVESQWYDKSKIVVSSRHTELTGPQLADRLRWDYHLESEMAAGYYVVLMTSVGDRKEGFERLEKALKELDATLTVSEGEQPFYPLPRGQKGKDRIATDYICLYPPGIPVVVPGEEMTQEVVSYLEIHKALGCTIVGWEQMDE